MLRRCILWLVIFQAFFFSSCTDFLLFQEAVGYKKAQTFNITFDSQGAIAAEELVVLTVTEPAKTLGDLPSAPEKLGYTFGGWYTQENGAGTAFTTSTTVSASLTVYAKWTPVVYSITYIVNSGTQNAANLASYTIESAAIPLGEPTRVDYYFGGWFDNAGCTGDSVSSISSGSTGNKTFWAAWTLVPVYIVTFDGAGATTAASPASMTVTDPATTITALPTAPVKTGYTFGGWYTQENGAGTAFTTSTTVSASLTVYAKWTPVVYSITYNLNSGTQNPANPASYTIETDTITLADPTRATHYFAGWYENVGLTGDAVSTIAKGSTGNKTFWAAWTLVPVYIVTFDGQGATTAASPATMTVTVPATTVAALPTAPEKTGYTFGGWYTQENGEGTAFTASTPVSTSLTVYAKWTPIVYTITYNLNSGTQNPTNPASYTVETDTITLADPTRNAYYFSDWYENVGLTGDAVTTIPIGSTGNKTFWAAWTLVPVYIVTFDGAGATTAASPASMTVTDPATTITALPTAPVKTGYTFGGWYTQENGLGTAFTASTPVRASLTVYAKWTPVVYTITYNLNSGTQNPTNPASYNVETATITLSTPTRADYAFGGWYANVGLTGTPVTSIPIGSTGNKTFYAKWTPVVYTITYNLNRGTQNSTNPASYNVETATIMLATPTRTGYAFGGWYANVGLTGTTVTSIPTGSTGNKTFYAKWNLIYTITYNLNGGTQNPANPASYTVETATITLATPTRTGRTFIGWFDNTLCTGSAVTEIPKGSTGNKVFRAKWNAVVQEVSPKIGNMKFVPAGTYQRDGTAANISSVSAFLMSETQVTRAQFLDIMGTDPSDTFHSSGTTDPVQNVNWYQAIAFCNKLSIAEGLELVYSVTGIDFSTLNYASIPTSSNTDWNAATTDWNKNGYRLPTEMEWMWAAMGATSDRTNGNTGTGINTTGYTKMYAGSIETGTNIGNIGNYAWYSTNSSNKTHPVGEKTANELGLRDMSGNVWEWCWDWYGGYPAGTLQSDTPAGRGAVSGFYRVLHGGSANNVASLCTVAYRGLDNPNNQCGLGTQGINYGFRVVRP